MLRASAIRSDVAVERGYRTVQDPAELAALGFKPAQRRVPALLVPIRDVHGEIATHQVRPDEPRPARREGKFIKYETRAGSRMVVDVPSRVRARLGDPTSTLWITEGAKKVDALLSHGCDAIGLLGVWNWRGTNAQGGKTVLADFEHVAWNGRRVLLAFDSDAATKPEVARALRRLRGLLESRGAQVQVVQLPSEPGGAKLGVDDYLAAGHDVASLEALATQRSRGGLHAATAAPAYFARAGSLWRRRPNEDADSDPVRLTNFTARICAEVIEDDGASEHRLLDIEAVYAERTARFRLSASEFSKMDWPIERVAATCWIVPGGRTLREHARVAIQELSGVPPTRRLLVHTGWREVDGRWVYLHAEGALTADGQGCEVEVDLPQQLGRYAFRAPGEAWSLATGWAAVRRFLAVAPARVTYTLLGFLARTSLGGIDCAVHLEGESGVFKSELAALAQQFFGRAMSARALPAAWASTANALERLAFHAKDALLVVDDFVPRGSHTDVQRAHRDAERLLRAQGNQAGRGRMSADASLRVIYYPRGGILSTGEEVPAGQSLQARLLVLHVARGDVDVDRLSECQRDAAAGDYELFLGAFLAWCAARLTELRADLPERLEALCAHTELEGAHRRTPRNAAQILLGVEILLQFVAEQGLVDASEHTDLRRTAGAALDDAARSHAREQPTSDPAHRFIELLSSTLSSGRAHLADRSGGVPPAPERWGWRIEPHGDETRVRAYGERVGWIDGEDVYLDMEAAYAAVERLAGQAPLGVSRSTLQKRLVGAGLVASTDEARRTHCVRRTLEGRQRTVLHVRAGVLGVGKEAAEPATAAVGFVGDVGSTAGHPRKEGGIPRTLFDTTTHPPSRGISSPPDKADKSDNHRTVAASQGDFACRVASEHPTRPTSEPEDPSALAYAYEERAAIREFDGGAARAVAERDAADDVRALRASR